jgi:RHS repeat-associated protein
LTAVSYAGQYTDLETGYQYLRARYYDPATGQFLTRDPAVAATGQAYSYGNGDPLNEVDPLGLAAYHFSFDLGSLGSPQDLAAYTRANCSSLFPIAGCVDNFEVDLVLVAPGSGGQSTF